VFAHMFYSITHERLQATVGVNSFSVHAVSGFGRGWQKTQDEPQNFPTGRTALTYVDKKDWGPIPPGYYRVCRPGNDPTLGRCAKLEPSAGPVPFGRGGFYLHGRAKHKHHGQFHKHASHGCICPLHDSDVEAFNQMFDALEQVQAKSTARDVAMLRVTE
jgi:hypothetical protein